MHLTELISAERPEHPYFAQVYDFVKSWKSGRESFTMSTSGSTGTPKIIALTRSQLIASAHMTGKALELGEGTRALVCLNIGYIAGMMMLVRALELGWETDVVEPVANPLLEVSDNAMFDFVALVPMQLTEILNNPQTQHRIGQFGKILLGGAPVSFTLEQLIKMLPVQVYQSYGMTETVSHVALRRINGADASGFYSFVPGIHFGVDGRGCLYISGEVTNGELVKTNDLVEIKGNLFRWLGRADNVINSGGVKIVLDQADEQIAGVFNKLNVDRPFFCWHIPDERLGQKLILVMEGSSVEMSEQILISELKKHISAYQIPKHIYFATRFEKTPSGKIDKRRTVQQFLNS